jgi:hypothetical protein
MSDDITQRDLSKKADADLTGEERLELARRFAAFVGRLRANAAAMRTAAAVGQDARPPFDRHH